MNAVVVKKAHGKTSRHDNSVPLYVQNSFPNKNSTSSPFAKNFHVDIIVKLPTFQSSLVLLLGMCVPLLELLHDLRRVFKVLWIWFALLHLFRTVRKSQVLPAVDRPKKVAQSAKQASFRVTLLRASLLRERTSQDLVRVHCCYWSMVVLWPGLHRSGDLPTTWR